jgi:hypothetical protein
MFVESSSRSRNEVWTDLFFYSIQSLFSLVERKRHTLDISRTMHNGVQADAKSESIQIRARDALESLLDFSSGIFQDSLPISGVSTPLLKQE